MQKESGKVVERLLKAPFDTEILSQQYCCRGRAQTGSLAFKVGYGRNGFRAYEGLDLSLGSELSSPRPQTFVWDCTGDEVCYWDGLVIGNLVKSYSSFFNDAARILPLSDVVHISNDKRNLTGVVTLDFSEALYVLIIQPTETAVRTPRRPHKAALLDVVRRDDRWKYAHYIVLPIDYQENIRTRSFIMQGFRAHEYDEYLRRNFRFAETTSDNKSNQSGNIVAGTDLMATPISGSGLTNLAGLKDIDPNDYRLLHYQDTFSHEQNFAILNDGRMMAPTVEPLSIYTEAEVQEFQTWRDKQLSNDTTIVKHRSVSCMTPMSFDFIKRPLNDQFTDEQMATLTILEKRFTTLRQKELKAFPGVISSDVDAQVKTWTEQINELRAMSAAAGSSRDGSRFGSDYFSAIRE